MTKVPIHKLMVQVLCSILKLDFEECYVKIKYPKDVLK